MTLTLNHADQRDVIVQLVADRVPNSVLKTTSTNKTLNLKWQASNRVTFPLQRFRFRFRKKKEIVGLLSSKWCKALQRNSTLKTSSWRNLLSKRRFSDSLVSTVKTKSTLLKSRIPLMSEFRFSLTVYSRKFQWFLFTQPGNNPMT